MYSAYATHAESRIENLFGVAGSTQIFEMAMKTKALLFVLSLAVGCATPPPPTAPEPDASLLEDHLVAARARRDEAIRNIETAKLAGIDWDGAKFRRIVWSGDAADFCAALSKKVPIKCRVIGKRAWVLPITLAARDVPLDDVLRDAGAQLGARADLILSGDGVTLEYKIPD